MERKVSGGYATYDDLYNHRVALFMALMTSNPDISWRAKKRANGQDNLFWFVAGMHLPTGDISYNLPMWVWSMLDKSRILTLEAEPLHGSNDADQVEQRLLDWVEEGCWGSKR